MKWENYRERERLMWDDYWEKENISLQKKVVKFVREKIFARECYHYFNKYFNDDDIVLEAGSGSSGTSGMIKKSRQRIIALDLSFEALRLSTLNNKVDYNVQGDIFYLPFKKNSINCIWNYGVMEHFYRDDVKRVLNEFYRVLNKNGRVILFWPSTKLPMSKLLSIIVNFGLKLPQSVYNPKKDEIKELLSKTGFKKIKINISFSLNHYVVIGFK